MAHYTKVTNGSCMELLMVPAESVALYLADITSILLGAGYPMHNQLGQPATTTNSTPHIPTHPVLASQITQAPVPSSFLLFNIAQQVEERIARTVANTIKCSRYRTKENSYLSPTTSILGPQPPNQPPSQPPNHNHNPQTTPPLNPHQSPT